MTVYVDISLCLYVNCSVFEQVGRVCFLQQFYVQYFLYIRYCNLFLGKTPCRARLENAQNYENYKKKLSRKWPRDVPNNKRLSLDRWFIRRVNHTKIHRRFPHVVQNVR